MANQNSILYQVGSAVKDKIATELANVSSGATGYTQNIGDNSATTINVTHNLNSDNIIYSLRDLGTNEYVHTQTERVDSNTIKFVFDTAPTTNQYLVTIISTDGSTGGSTCASSPVTITVSSDTSGGLYTPSDSSGNGDLFGCINAYRGQTLTIDVVGSSADLQSHPLQITNYNDLGQAMAPLSGVVKTQYGDEYTLTWTVPCDETVTKYQYQCSNHAGMRGTINVLGSCGDNTTNIESYLGSLDTHIIPDTNAAYDLGTAEKKFRHLYLSSNTLYMGDDNTPIRLDSNKKLLVNDVEVGGTTAIYTKATLPLNASAGTTALVTDGTTTEAPTMSYFYDGKWYRTFDNSEIVNQTVDLFIIAGQSNALGKADVSDLTTAQATQNGLFYTSWHDTQSDAETTQYYSDWATSLVAGSTRGESSFSTLGNSSYFGPELGFVSQANAINLTTQPIGIIKYAVGGSILNAGTPTPDWDTTATGTNEGDCYRGLLSALSDATTNLTNAGYSWNFKGMIWWQGESGTSVSGLNTFISAVRTLLGNSYGVTNPSQFPVVITKIGYGDTDLTPVASADAYVEIVDAATYGQSASQVHVGNASEGSSDTTGNGVNDMFDIGKAYADKMASIIAGTQWSPSNLSTTVWLDASDASSIIHSSNAVSQWSDKSGNNYHFTQSTAANNPTTNLSTIGGLNALDFDGSDTPSQADFLRNISVPFSGTHSIFVVMLARSADVNFTRVLENSNGFVFGLGSGNTDFMTIYRNTAGTGWNDLDTNTPTQSVLNVGIFGVTNDNSIATPYVNGTAQNTKNGDMTVNMTGGISLGAWASGDQAFDGIIGEVIITPNKLSDADRQKVEGYLAHKWGLTAELPSSHPYKTQTP